MLQRLTAVWGAIVVCHTAAIAHWRAPGEAFPYMCDVENWPTGGYLDTTDIPTDGWNRDFIYELYPESGKPFVIKSLGADGQEEGEGNDEDLLSTDR